MSYEGYHEFLCVNGHRTHVDCNESDPKACERCGGSMAFWNSVDRTNGQDPDYPGSMPAEKIQIGNMPVTILIPIYKPAPNSRWRPLHAPDAGDVDA
jgi:hypothetical protein